MRKQVMSLAWALIKAVNNTINNLSDALRAAWKAIKAKAAINDAGAMVEFIKSDGTRAIRAAKRFAAEVKGTGRSNPLTVVYYDPINQKTGSFRADRLINWTPVIAHV